jgi:hypothetical protein
MFALMDSAASSSLRDKPPFPNLALHSLYILMQQVGEEQRVAICR